MVGISYDKMRVDLLSSLPLFTKFFFQEVNQREYRILYNQQDNISAQQLFWNVMLDLWKGRYIKAIINQPPRLGKTTLISFSVAWFFTHCPGGRYLYSSANSDLCETVVHLVRSILTNKVYVALFGNIVSNRKNIKTGFFTKCDGEFFGYGLGGAFVGRGAGIRGEVNGKHGMLIMDDWTKGQDIFHPAIKRRVERTYNDTARSRINSIEGTPQVYIGHRMISDDISGFLIGLNEGWNVFKTKSLDEHDRSFDEKDFPARKLVELRNINPLVFYCQYQQEPKDAGSFLFRKEWFVLLEKSPVYSRVFMVIDTGESDKKTACNTVMSLFGMYEIENHFHDFKVGNKKETGLHWIDALIIKPNPNELENECAGFFMKACQITGMIPPIYIEKKSTGTMLFSILSNKYRGVIICPIIRGRTSKLQRFSMAVPYCARRLISMPLEGDHVSHCLMELSAIETNCASRMTNDTVDTLADAIDLVYEKKVFSFNEEDTEEDEAYYHEQNYENNEEIYESYSI